MGHGPHSSKLVVICVVLLLFVLFYVLFVCKCVLYYCHRVLTQLQLTNISYHIICEESRVEKKSFFLCTVLLPDNGQSKRPQHVVEM